MNVSDLNLLPIFSINRIIVDRNKITLSCSLNRPSNLNYSNWFTSNRFYKYINFYFLAAPKLRNTAMARYYYPETRVLELARSINVATQNWEESLSRIRLDRGRRGGAPRVNINRVFAYSKVNLDEILQDHFDISDPVRAMHLESVMDTAGSLADDHDVYFEIVIDTGENIFPPQSQGNIGIRQPPEEVNIMAFSQIDIKALHEEFGIDPVDSGLSQIGGNLVFEKCLERSELSNLGMRVPPTRKVFTLPDGRFYSGPVHYHANRDGERGPNGYVGYMAGPTGADMSSQDILSVREVPNNKVVAKVLTDSALNADGQLLDENNSFNGFVNDSSFEAEDYGMVSLGDSMISALRSQYGSIISIGGDNVNSNRDEILKRLCIASLRKGKLNVTHSFENISTTDLSWINIAGRRPYHGSLFAIDFANLLKYNSEYGHIVERHATFNRDNPNPSARSAIEKSDRLLQNFVNLSRIYSMRIVRERVTNHPLGNNLVSTPDFEKLNEDQIAKDMVSTTSPPRNNQGLVPDGSTILDTQNRICQISELEPSSQTQRKLFFVKDYDLFERHSFGNYEYKLDIKIHDGVLLNMKTELSRLRRSIIQYERYVEEASRPYIDPASSAYFNGSSIEVSQQEGRAKGNYNHFTKSFTVPFILRSERLRARSDNIVDSYFDSYFLLTANPAFTEGQKELLKTSLLPQNTTLEFLEFFLSLCKKLESRFETILGLSGMDEKDTVALDSNPKPVASSKQTPKSIIHLIGSTNIIAKAVSKNSIFVRALPVDPVDASVEIQIPDVNFFTLNTSTSSNTEIEYTIQDLARISTRQTAEENNESFALVSSALSRLDASGATTIEGEELIKDKYKQLDNLLATYKNTTVRTLISEAAEPIEKDANTQAQRKKFLDTETQESILASIIEADNSKAFEEEAEKTYKDFYMSTKSLGNLYSAVKEALTNSQIISDSKKQQATTYKEKVIMDTNSETENAKSDARYQKSIRDKAEHIITSEHKEPGIAATIVVQKKKDFQFEGAVLVDNVQFSETSSGNENAAEFETTRRRSGSRSKTPPARAITRKSSPNTGGGKGYS